MRVLFILLVVVSFFSCETKEQKEKRLLREKVFDSHRMLTGIQKHLELTANVSSAKGNIIPKARVIKEYNNTLGYLFGRSTNLDTIEARLKRKRGLYMDYLVQDTYAWYVTDSLVHEGHIKNRDSIAELLNL